MAPPEECITGTHSEWQWDEVKHAWVAQVTLGNFASITIKIYEIVLYVLHMNPSFLRPILW